MIKIKQTKSEKRKHSIISQVAIFFLVGILTTGIMTYICESYFYDNSVKNQTEIHAAEIATEVKRTVIENPAHIWLIKYWYAHLDELDIEYDAAFDGRNLTAEKCRVFQEHNPELQLRYLDNEQCAKLSPEDQKLYAEIAYSWLITRIDQIKQSYHISYLFCVIPEDNFEGQFFVFSGAKKFAVRGTKQEEAYILGKRVPVNESQKFAMREAIRNSSHLADAGAYVDYYANLCSFDSNNVLIGLTYDLSDLRADIKMKTRSGATLAILNQLILSLICLALILFFVLRPLKKVQSCILEYKNSKDSKTVTRGLSQINAHNEIGNLSDDVSNMICEIDAHIEKIEHITAEKERISAEMELATRIQYSMLPSIFPPFPDRKEFSIYASMDPAKEVGGDFYDFFLVDDDHLCMVIADVSGKGVPAALFMMASKIILANNAKMGKSPSQILTDTNNAICSNNPERMFVTVWLGILEISTGKLTAANAGHEYPAIKRADSGFELYKDKHGLVIGGMEGIQYKEYEIQLEKGDRLFVYTDGVPEATNSENQLFGTDRMVKALNEMPYADPLQILKNIRKNVDGFVNGAEQFDDLTMLCIEYKGKDID